MMPAEHKNMAGNQIKTAVLLGLLTGLLLGVGYLAGGSNGLFIALIFSVAMNFSAYWFSDKIALAMYRAQPVSKEQAPNLYNMVESVCHKAKLPMPKIYMIPAESPNAFATGRNQKHAALAVTQGIVKLLNKEEMEGVIAHELAHIKNRDILIQSVAAMIAGVISYLAMMARFGALFGGFGGRDRDRGSMVELLILAIVTPIIAMIIQLAISRSREYMADSTGALILKSGKGLASALDKLDKAIQHTPFRRTTQAQATAHMFIANPFRAEKVMGWFMTHPPMKERIRKLNEIKF
jgi:heat shock protein HtpX